MSSPTIWLISGTAGTLALPSPSIDSAWERDPTQKLHRASGGTRRCYTMGPNRYALARRIEFLREAEYDALLDWLILNRWKHGLFTYKQRWPGHPGQYLQWQNVRLKEDPKFQRGHHNNWSVDLNLEFKVIPTPSTAEIVLV